MIPKESYRISCLFSFKADANLGAHVVLSWASIYGMPSSQVRSTHADPDFVENHSFPESLLHSKMWRLRKCHVYLRGPQHKQSKIQALHKYSIYFQTNTMLTNRVPEDGTQARRRALDLASGAHSSPSPADATCFVT